ncbi:hypothetical protein LXA43DRAFT_14004 [Ganoderma leucocontextum]|nr:hypothetical protein LXA43DRAFT_14004 [Ganoderma leucocontextum]
MLLALRPKAPWATVFVALANISRRASAQLPFPSFAPVPPVLIPAKGDKWQVGDLRTVEWGITNVSLTNSSGAPLKGTILLSYDAGDILSPIVLGHQPLAQSFTISQKVVNIYVPEVPTRSDYRITLNAAEDGLSRSGTITIFNPNDPQGTGAAPSSLVVSSAPPISVTVVLPTPTNDDGSSTSTSTTISPSTSSRGLVSTSVSVTQAGTPGTNGACPVSGRDVMDMTTVVLLPLLTAFLAQSLV